MLEQFPLLISTLCYFLSCCSTLLGLSAGKFRPQRFPLFAMIIGVLAQSWFLLHQGKFHHSCPIHTLPEIIIFLSWAIGLFYLLIGSTYRVSLMGVFTAPLILGLQAVALLLPFESFKDVAHFNPWIEAHAALSLIAFGAFGLASVSSMMFLIQEKELKSQSPSSLFHYLPPITTLEVVTKRLLWLGFFVLTISFALGFIASPLVLGIKFLLSVLIWGSYGMTLFLQQKHYFSSHRFAWSAISVFSFALIVVPLVRYNIDLSVR